MRIFGYSINHRTCDIKLREALALNDEERGMLIERLRNKGVKEGIILSTCNRTEVIAVGEDDVPAKVLLDETLKVKNIIGLGKNNFDEFYEEEAIEHLFAVASGIDSLIVGDSQILGQVKESFLFSAENQFTGPIFNRLQLATLKLGKRVISETAIGEGAVSVSFAAIKLIEKYYNTLRDKTVLIIGAGETAKLAAIHIADKNPVKIYVTNRTPERGVKLAEKVGGEFVGFEDFKSLLHNVDVIISATSSKDFILSYDEVKSAMKKRKGKILVIMDIALPRDVDPKVAQLEEVFYQDIDSLNIIVDQNIERRKAEIPKVKEIIATELRAFYEWFNTLDVLPTVKKLRAFFEEIRQDEMEKIKYKLNEREFEKVNEMTRRLLGRILHNPTVNLKSLSNLNEEEKAIYCEVIKELFNIDNENDTENKSESI